MDQEVYVLIDSGSFQAVFATADAAKNAFERWLSPSIRGYMGVITGSDKLKWEGKDGSWFLSKEYDLGDVQVLKYRILSE